MGVKHHQRVGKRRGFLILALLALWMQVLVPAGFMVSTTDGNPNIVICTGHGALDLADHDHSGKAPQSKADAPCVFAGHGLATETPEPMRVAAPVYAYAASPAPAFEQSAPGRGLAAPPPPSRGPPLV
jgi:hypothetical protein